MTSPSLGARLSTLSDANKATVQLINRLAKLNFQPGSTPLDSTEGDVRIELSDEIHQGLKQQEEEFELLKQEAEDYTYSGGGAKSKHKDSERERERVRLSVQITRLGEDLRHIRSQFRKAQLQAKRNAELAKQKERELLFAGVQEGRNTPTSDRRRGQKELSADDLIVERSGDVTTALRQLHQSMRIEVERSRYAQETLDQSTAALKDLSEHYTSLDDLLASSRTLLSTLIQSQKSDTWYLETALYALVVTIIWLIFRRFFYGPLWWFVWFPFKLTYKLVFGVIGTTGVTGSSSVAAQALSSASTALKVQPSASNRPPAHSFEQGQPAPSIRVGGGGRGAPYHPPDPSPQGSLSQSVGQMAENSQKQPEERQPEERQPEEKGSEEKGSEEKGSEEKQKVVLGDGTVLEERSDQPVNPKKRMMVEEDLANTEQNRDEL